MSYYKASQYPPPKVRVLGCYLDEDMEWVPVVVWYNYEHNKWVTYGDKCPPIQLWTYLPEPPNGGL